MNSWIEILLAHKNGVFPEYDYGLTPRFIIGACQIPIGKTFNNENMVKKATEQMFKEMINYDYGELIVTSNFCDIHNGPVMCLADQKWSEKTIGTTFDEIWERYGSEIERGDYHISREEKQIVERIFAMK